jgi:predicted porin
MQKKLIVLAIAAMASTSAFADSVTTVYGVIDAGYGTVSNTSTNKSTAITADPAKTTQSGTAFSQNQTSRVGVKSVEDLGGGMKAVYQLEIGLSSNPASDAAFGSTSIGTSSSGFVQNSTISPDRVMSAALDFGQGTTVVAGRVSSPLRGISYGYDADYGSNFVGNLVTSDADLITRANALAVVQAFGPVTATAAMLQNTTKTQTAGATSTAGADVLGGNGYEVTATFKQAALSVAAGYRDLEATTVNATSGTLNSILAGQTSSDVHTKVMILAASYDLGVAKVYGQYATVDKSEGIATATTTAGKNTYESFGVNVPITPTLAGFIELSAGKNARAANNATYSDSRNLSAYAIGAVYTFSKTTSVYADIGSEKLSNSINQAGSQVDQIALGILKSF